VPGPGFSDGSHQGALLHFQAGHAVTSAVGIGAGQQRVSHFLHAGRAVALRLLTLALQVGKLGRPALNVGLLLE
jgi:hypothetical protein